MNQLNPQLAALALRTGGGAQRHSFAYVPPEARRGNTPVRTPEDSTPPVPKADNGTPVAKPEGPKMVRDGGRGLTESFCHGYPGTGP